MKTLICSACSREMLVLKNGVTIRYDRRWAYSGDSFICPNCCREVILADTDTGHEMAGDLTGDDLLEVPSAGTTSLLNGG